jgi:hypothetical protein
MDVTDKFEQVGVSLTKNRFVTVLKEMPMTVMAAIEVSGISTKQPFHDCCNRRGPGLKQQVEMIWDENPCKASGRSFQEDTTQTMKEFVPILIIGEDTCALDTTANDMVKSAGGVYAGLAGHATKIATGFSADKR